PTSKPRIWKTRSFQTRCAIFLDRSWRFSSPWPPCLRGDFIPGEFTTEARRARRKTQGQYLIGQFSGGLPPAESGSRPTLNKERHSMKSPFTFSRLFLPLVLLLSCSALAQAQDEYAAVKNWETCVFTKDAC